MDKEIWKDIEGYEGLYQVSNLGRIARLSDRKGNQLAKPRILENVINTNGYIVIQLYKNNKRKYIRVHRLVAQAFIPNPDNKPCVNHINGIKTDNRVENLEFCTYSENTIHAYRNGLEISKRGETVYNAKLTNKEAKQIRKEYIPYSKEYSLNALAKRYGVSKRTVFHIIHNKTYKE